MDEYEAQVQITVTKTYYVVLRVTARDKAEAAAKLKHEALGMEERMIQQHIERARSGSDYYDGEARDAEVYQVEMVPDEPGEEKSE